MDHHAQHHPRSHACVLPNGLRLHLAHDPAASRAAAWLRVAAGSHDEPSAHPGLAHFLEHLSFLGGAAFPGDERLMPWLQVRGGQVNASTRGRTTDYFFEVTAEHLGAGLARLIDMLARPLLDIDAQRREREVLEAEYLARSADEQTLIDAALALGLPAGHPLRRFAAGRRDSLALENDAFQRALREFHAAHYHAGNCQLWLQGPQALDELERLAQRACADLPGRAPGASPPPLPLLPFAGEALALRLPGPPRLVLGFALDALREADEQTLQAFAELLGDRSPGGLLAALGEQGLGESAALRVVHRDARQALLALTFELFDGSATAALEAAFFDWLGALRDDAASLLAARRPLLAEPTAPLERLRQRVLGLPAEIRPACLDALRADRCLRLHLDSELDGAEARWSAGFRLSVAPVAAAPPLAAQRHAWRFELPLPPSAAAEGALFLRWRFPGVPARSRFLALRQALRPLCGQARLGGVEMGLEALGEDWSLCLLGPRDRLEAAVRPALARLLAAPPDWRASGERLSSAERRRSATGLPIRQLLDALPGLLGEPLAEVDDWRRTRWDALVMQAAMPDPRWMPGQAAGERLEPLPPRPGRHRRELAVDGESALLLFCPLPTQEVPMEAAWRLLARLHEPAFQRRLRDELQLGYALFCGFREVGARRGLLFAAQSPRACPERLLEHMETFLQRSVEAFAQLPARRLAGLREALADDLRRAPGSFAERARRAWAEHLGGGAGRSRLLAEAALGLSGDDLLAAQARLLEARGGWWVLSSRR
ncbi:pyrroloquinoline quinone biosynthesis protein PqqF [Pseudomonas aeruginosa]|uniref:pyrroloquinoline quinone biosynthesis protein PqqF n=1 Tax=Pseudomonas aeruginosa TaxID=287 RepID=UPI002904804A|nr:pyrroloquinoline quinone biosynthesis protein PqqF [Pseudomonas aeruginosa]MDU0524004.1 pyrroloquinoline quinone biosynthesis protein PqqF [Pseudomonas aeruginosa]MDU0566423.1 pyrroloquinoline quinone biosynthesis protein PqqF [Pseudomonas aeruginosa]